MEELVDKALKIYERDETQQKRLAGRTLDELRHHPVVKRWVAAMGKKSTGGTAKNSAMSPEERKAHGQKMADARWGKKRNPVDSENTASKE